MKNLEKLNQKILSKQAKIGVIGLGYVGLPVACMFARAGFTVTGVDIKQARVEQINNGICPIEGNEPDLPELLADVVNQQRLKASSDYKPLHDADIVLIDVETPTDQDNIPQYVALRSACSSLAQVMKDGAFVIIESTIAPGTVEKVVRPLLEAGVERHSNADFYLGACPERVMPGKLLSNLKAMSRVCGGETPEVAQTMTLLYRNVVEADLDTADIITAETTKTAENTYRDVNIAFANELAMICQAVGADFLKVRELVNKSPGRNVLLAGAGVGGHCIPKDPWLLAYGAHDQVALRLIPAARAVNDTMPLYMAELTEQTLQKFGINLSQSRIAVLGYAYLEESDDTRNSPTEILIQYLKSKGADLVVHDPYIFGYQNDFHKCISGSDALVIMVAHNLYKQMDLRMIRTLLSTPILIDGRRIIDPVQAKKAGLHYYGIGYGTDIRNNTI